MPRVGPQLVRGVAFRIPRISGAITATGTIASFPSCVSYTLATVLEKPLKGSTSPLPLVLSGAAAAYSASLISVGIGAILYAVIGLAAMAPVPGYIPIEQPRPVIEDHASGRNPGGCTEFLFVIGDPLLKLALLKFVPLDAHESP
jgi:hypothetical protein